MTRVPELQPEQLSAAQKRIYDDIVAGPRGQVIGPLRVWLHSPGLADPAQKLGAYARFNSVLPARLSELAILVTARFWRAQFEWYAHAPMARDGGLGEDIIEAIHHGREPAFANDDEAIVYKLSRELHETHQVSDQTYDAARTILGQDGVVDLVGVVGYYTLVSMTLNCFQVPLPEGAPLPFTD